ncbi:cyanophycin synthetase [Curvibacter sp. CHRR-16]|uniref:cyanophycin synthetase n=1 Tax=Curvibacter sp. CHRR-16 TaxID=2835872 RepID=UPI001BDB013B|nr:cyanophycin synthetase [Curvibacter sp. CHRR-16]MBT0568827.1 cyanophycin synthetase [Curvibacter sp. CHRR-16]
MEISRVRALRGPNLWTHHTAIQAIVQCQPAECDISYLTGFEDRLRRLFPQLSALHPVGHEERMSLARVLAQVALDLQAQSGCPVTFTCTAPTLDEGVYQVVVEYSEEEVGRKAFEEAQKLCQAALNDGTYDLNTVLADLRELDEDVRLGPSTGSIVDAAVVRGIPYSRMTEGSMVRLGWGSKQRRIQAAEIDATSAIAEAIAQDKQLSKRLLAAAGVPVPEGREVVDAEDAWKAAQEIGLPVVVKPQDGNQGKGVTVNITSQEQLYKAFAAAKEHRDNILVERFMPGSDYRLLVVGDRLVAAARREPPAVVGDGIHTVKQLVDKVNEDPRRGTGHATSLTKIRFDDIAKTCLSNQGLQPDSIPPKGQRVLLRHNANLSTGGSATDVTDDVHPDVAARAVAAAQMIGLDICGVDVVCESILRPLEEQGGGIVEVNAAPGLRMHLSPSYGKGRPVGEAIVNTLFKRGQDGRIPIVAVTGTNGKTTTVRLISHILTQHQLRVGMTNTDGVYVNGHCIDTGDCSGPRSARNVLYHPDVDAAVLETARGGILREGLAFDHCDVAVVTNIGAGDHLGLNYITTVDELAVLKRVIVQNVAPHGTAVLNAADPIVAAMASKTKGRVIFFAADAGNPIMTTHRAHGHTVVYVERGEVVLATPDAEYRYPLANVPITMNGAIGFQVENTMASVAAAWGLGLPWDTICKGIATFSSDSHNAAGRFNLFNYRGATVIADYGHNPDAMTALVHAVEALPASRRSVVISGAGDRRDQDIRQQTEILGRAFDEVVLFEDACQRGRNNGEVIALLREGLANAPRTKERHEVHGEFKAIDMAMDKLQAGELCLILVDQVAEAMAHIAAKCETGR